MEGSQVGFGGIRFLIAEPSPDDSIRSRTIHKAVIRFVESRVGWNFQRLEQFCARPTGTRQASMSVIRIYRQLTLEHLTKFLTFIDLP